MKEVVKEILMIVGIGTVAFIIVCFLDVIKEKIKSWRKNGCKIKCLCKHEYDINLINIVDRNTTLKCRKCGKRKKVKNLSRKAIDKLLQMERII